MAAGQTRQAPTQEQRQAEAAQAAQAAATGGEKKARKGTEAFVQWTGANAGIGSLRKITTANWGQRGIADAKETRFEAKHGYRLPESAFNAKQLEYLYDVDGFFVKVDKDGNPFKVQDADE